MERLLLAPEFKSIACLYWDELDNDLNAERMNDFTSKLEFGILALILCKTTNLESKVNFLYHLSNPN